MQKYILPLHSLIHAFVWLSERERQRERDRKRDRETERQRDRERERDRERQREREREKGCHYDSNVRDVRSGVLSGISCQGFCSSNFQKR